MSCYSITDRAATKISEYIHVECEQQNVYNAASAICFTRQLLPCFDSSPHKAMILPFDASEQTLQQFLQGAPTNTA